MKTGSALLVIDAQNDVMAHGHDRNGIVANIADLVERARRQSVPVVWVQHRDDDLVAGTPGWQIVPELSVAAGEVVVHKECRDAFDGTTLTNELNRLAVKRLIVTGAQTDFCVRWTLHGAQTRGFETVLVSDAHTTDDADRAIPTAAQLIEHTNRYWSHQPSSGGLGEVSATADVGFA